MQSTARLGNTAAKKRHSDGEPLAILFDLTDPGIKPHTSRDDSDVVNHYTSRNSTQTDQLIYKMSLFQRTKVTDFIEPYSQLIYMFAQKCIPVKPNAKHAYKSTGNINLTCILQKRMIIFYVYSPATRKIQRSKIVRLIFW